MIGFKKTGDVCCNVICGRLLRKQHGIMKGMNMGNISLSSNTSRKPRILTDIQIEQSKRWCEETEYMQDYSSVSYFIALLPPSIRSTLNHFRKIIQLISRAKSYDVIILANIKTVQLFGLYRKIFHIKLPKQIVLELMLDEEKNNILWRLKKIIQCVAFADVDIIFVSARPEVETYTQRLHLNTGRVRFLPFHTNITAPRIEDSHDDYILSAGKTGRDYEILANAFKDINERLIIVSNRASIEHIEFSTNVELICDMPYSQYIQLMKNCKYVIVPLRKLVKSTGQVVILEAMALGKPVITSSTTGTIDYIQHGINGLLYNPGDVVALKNEVIKLSSDQILYKKLALNALESIKLRHTFEIYVDTIINASIEISNMASNS